MHTPPAPVAHTRAMRPPFGIFSSRSSKPPPSRPVTSSRPPTANTRTSALLGVLSGLVTSRREAPRVAALIRGRPAASSRAHARHELPVLPQPADRALACRADRADRHAKAMRHLGVATARLLDQ